MQGKLALQGINSRVSDTPKPHPLWHHLTGRVRRLYPKGRCFCCNPFSSVYQFLIDYGLWNAALCRSRFFFCTCQHGIRDASLSLLFLHWKQVLHFCQTLVSLTAAGCDWNLKILSRLFTCAHRLHRFKNRAAVITTISAVIKASALASSLDSCLSLLPWPCRTPAWCFCLPFPSLPPPLCTLCRQLACHAYVCYTSTALCLHLVLGKGWQEGQFLTNVWLNMCETNSLCVPCGFSPLQP